MQADRHNKGKRLISLVPTSLINSVADVMLFGAKKYDKNNWRKGLPFTSVYDSLQRHMLSWLDGEDLDKESGLPHLAHAACNIAFLLEYSLTKPELDDRFKQEVKNGKGA